MEEEIINQYEEEDEIDIMAMLAKLLKKWKFIFLVTFIFSVLGVFFALKMKREYTVTVTLAPEAQNRSNSTVSAIASMMGMGGMSMNSTPDALNILLFPQISSSTPFLSSILPVEVTPYVSREKELEGVKPQSVTVFDHMLGRDKTLSERQRRKMEKADAEYLYDDSKIDPTRLTPRQGAVVRALGSAINTSVDNKTGVTTISVVMGDKMIAKQVADTVCQRLQDFVISYRIKKAQDDYNYYVDMAEEARVKLVKAQAAYASRVDYDRSVILQSVNSERERLQNEANLANQLYSQMVQQRELAKAKIQEVKPVYAVVQPASVPLRASNSRAKVCMVWFAVGLILSCAWVLFGEDLWKKMRTEMKDE